MPFVGCGPAAMSRSPTLLSPDSMRPGYRKAAWRASSDKTSAGARGGEFRSSAPTPSPQPSQCRCGEHRFAHPTGRAGRSIPGIKSGQGVDFRPGQIRGARLQRDVLVPSAPCRCLGQRLGDPATGVGGVDLLVDDTDLDGVVHTAGDPLVLSGQLVVQCVALVVGRGGQLLLVQNADSGLGAHYGDF